MRMSHGVPRSTSGDSPGPVRHPPRMPRAGDHEALVKRLGPDGPVLRMVPLGKSVAPLRLDPSGNLVYVQLSTGEQVGLSDANDAVGLLAQVHPTHDDDDRMLPTRYVRYDGIEVVEVNTLDGLLLVPSALVPYDDCGGQTVGPGSRHR